MFAVALDWLARAARSAPTSALLLLAVSIGASSPAWANGRFPSASQLVAMPGQPDTLILRATFGVLFSRDAGQTWSWLCEQAFGLEGQEDPALAALSGGALLTGFSRGLVQSTDPFCAWQLTELSAEPLEVVDLSVRPLEPREAVALAWRRVAAGNAFGYASEFYATSDAGLSWRPYGTGIDANVLVLTLDVAPSDPHRLYASGIRPSARTAALFVSIDDGQSWSERPVPFDSPREQGLYIGGVDPLDAERVYLRTSGAMTSRLFVTRDAGGSFEAVFAGRALLGFALSSDASEVYVGGPDNGLWAAARDELVFAQRASLPIQCLMSSGGLLYACSNELTGFALGVSSDGGREFTAKLRLSEVHGPLACPASSSGGVCPAEWPATAARLGVPPDRIEAGGSAMPGADGSTAAAPDGEAAASRGCDMAPRRTSERSPIELLLGVCCGVFALSRRQRGGRGLRRTRE